MTSKRVGASSAVLGGLTDGTCRSGQEDVTLVFSVSGEDEPGLLPADVSATSPYGPSARDCYT
jgi:hypothetical protein